MQLPEWLENMPFKLTGYNQMCLKIKTTKI